MVGECPVHARGAARRVPFPVIVRNGPDGIRKAREHRNPWLRPSDAGAQPVDAILRAVTRWPLDFRPSFRRFYTFKHEFVAFTFIHVSHAETACQVEIEPWVTLGVVTAGSASGATVDSRNYPAWVMLLSAPLRPPPAFSLYIDTPRPVPPPASPWSRCRCSCRRSEVAVGGRESPRGRATGGVTPPGPGGSARRAKPGPTRPTGPASRPVARANRPPRPSARWAAPTA